MSDTVRVLGFAGLKGAGKSTAAKAITNGILLAAHNCYEVNFADPLKNMLRALSLGGAELNGDAKEIALEWLDVTPRRLMQTLGTEWGRELIHPDLWAQLWERRTHEVLHGSPFNIVVVADVRFPNELEAVHRLGGKVAWVDRPGLEYAQHISERSLRPDHCDRLLANVGSSEELEAAALRFARQVGVLG